MTILKDDTPMPWGKHQGTQMADVPADYLMWLYENDKAGRGSVRHYIVNNLDVLRSQVAKMKPNGK